METKPLVVIVGPTASGKTSLAIEIAEKVGGEIICADSRTIYKYMDIGTAKPTQEEQSRVPHWGIDLVEPDVRFTAADFKRYADLMIAEIRSRGNIPMLVGGTGLYVDSVVFDYSFGPAADPRQRQLYESMSLEQLHKYCYNNNIKLPENEKNKRYVIRAIERKSTHPNREKAPIANTIIVGITTDKAELYQRIEQRAHEIVSIDIIHEAQRLADHYGWDHESMTGNIYPLCRSYIEGTLTMDELLSHFIILDRRLAKRQMTWLRRNPYIEWCSLDNAKGRILSLLASEQ